MAPHVGFADTSSEVERLRAEAQGMAQTIEETTATYQQAAADVDYLEQQIADNEARTAEIEAKLPEQRARAAASIKELYIFQQSAPGLLDLVLSSQDFNQFITTLRYIDTIHDRNTDQVKHLANLTAELDTTTKELSLQRDVAQQKEQEALNALEEARAARRELQAKADAIAAAEAQERANAIAAAQAAIAASTTATPTQPSATTSATQQTQQPAQQTQQQAQQPAQQTQAQQQTSQTEQPQAQQTAAPQEQAQPQEQQEQPAPAEPAQPTPEEAPTETPTATFTTNSGNTAPVEVPEEDTTSVSTEPLTSNTTDSEVGGWAARIDAYLAGSPLAGYGATFAEAAAAYGVDPRFSPAISCIESSKGAICFLPHNAWGWGSSSWSDWESAIYSHVAGLASMYGGTLTLEGAQMYCPPSYQEWYSSVLAEMNSI